MLQFTGERIVPGAANCEPLFAEKMYTEHSARYLLAAQLASGARVLDVGCGVGYGAQLLAKAGAQEVVAFDLAADAIAHAREFYAHPALRFHVRDATDFAFDGGFDLITCFELIEHVPDQEAVFRCIKAALAPGGLVVMSTPRALDQPRNEFHTHEYTLEEFQAAFARHFAHQRVLFENNHFTSLVTDGPPEVLDRIHARHPQFSLEQADYLIAIGTDGDPARLALPRPVMVVNNEAYVKLLERDTAILQARRIELDAEVAALRRDLKETEDRLAAAVALEDRISATVEAALAARTKDLIADTEQALLRAQEQVEQALARNTADAEQALANATWAIEHTHNRIAYVSQRALTASERAQDALSTHFVAMRHSASWRLTEPLRAVSAALQRRLPPLGRAMEYRRRFGGRAMVNRAVKVLVGRFTGRHVPPTPVLAHSSLDLLAPVQPAQAPLAVPDRVAPVSATAYDVIFAIGCWEGESRRYRVDNVADALRAAGRSVEVIPFSDLGRIMSEGLRPRVVVLFRAPDEPWIDRYFAYARQYAIRTIFDVDDLVFEPALVERVHGYHMLNAARQAEYRDGVARYRALLLKCDEATVSTQPLARAVQALGIPAHVVPNTWNHIQSDIATKLLATPRPAQDGLVIGYFSGSRTHDRDFQEAAPALLLLMRERQDVRLRLVGELDPGPGFAVFGERIERLPFQPYQDMLRSLHGCDIALAPLEPDNPFNEAKSELKWFEAALVGVPCIVAPTEPFQSAIRHGETGFVAAGQAEWHAALQALASDPALRDRIGAAAGRAARETFGPERARMTAEAAYALPKPASPAIVAVPGRRRVDWIVPGLIIGGGGHRNILRAAHFLEKFGHDVGLVFTNTQNSAAELRALLHEHFYPFSGPIRPFDHVFRYTDALFATHWTTVEPALRARGLTREVMYFVQDFEPLFAPMGTEYILAENTYRQGLYCITSGPWCEHLLKRDFGAEADHFEFPIDRDVYVPRPRTKENLNVLYFAKPEMPRRCYELGVLMLRELHRIMPEVEIIMYGSRNVDLGTLGFPAKLQGVLPTIHDLAQAYADADLGIAFSTTNPSLVPYEMMACGTPVVDLGRPGNEVNYGGRFDVALLADPVPARMAQQVRDLLLNPNERAARAKAGIELVARMPTEEQMARRVEELILRRLARV